MDAAAANANPNVPGASDAGAVRLDRMLSPDAVAANARVMYFCRIFMSIVGGCAAGVMGLHGLAGLAFYVLSVAAVTAALVAKTGMQVERYFANWGSLGILDGFSQGALSYVLFWTYVLHTHTNTQIPGGGGRGEERERKRQGGGAYGRVRARWAAVTLPWY